MERPPKCPDRCPGNTACDATGVCHLGCRKDGDCADGFICDDIFDTCEHQCVDEACPDGFACESDTGCASMCFERSDCQDGYRCNDNLECVD